MSPIASNFLYHLPSFQDFIRGGSRVPLLSQRQEQCISSPSRQSLRTVLSGPESLTLHLVSERATSFATASTTQLLQPARWTSLQLQRHLPSPRQPPSTSPHQPKVR